LGFFFLIEVVFFAEAAFLTLVLGACGFAPYMVDTKEAP
jgi:hypothetical protein